MRVLLWMAASGNGIQGGHQTQIQQTARHLEARGVRATVTSVTHPALTGCDIVHSFGLQPEHLRRCRRAGVPVVSSTIYWSRRYGCGGIAEQFFTSRWAHRIRMGLVLLGSALRGDYAAKCEAVTERQYRLRTVYEMSDLLLPNSSMEAKAIADELVVSTPMHVVPNAADARRFACDGGGGVGVVYAGRFEPHKNQLGLIQAMRGLRIPLTLVGPRHPHHEAYYRRCQRSLTSTMRILEPMDAELPDLFRSARVHAMPSWFETTGLASIEAALCGCNVVTTDRGYSREYFGELAWYCDPADRGSIRRAVEAAHEAPTRQELRERMLRHYTWEHTAAATHEAYEMVLAGMRREPHSGALTEMMN